MTEDISDEVRVVATEITDAQRGLKMQIQQGYVPPLDGSQGDLDAFDMRIAKGICLILCHFYYGYPWHVKADSAQGIVAFQIPELMGATLHYVIRLAEYRELTPELIMRCGGELLERMGLPRRRIDVPAFVAARDNKHTFDFAGVKGSN